MVTTIWMSAWLAALRGLQPFRFVAFVRAERARTLAVGIFSVSVARLLAVDRRLAGRGVWPDFRRLFGALLLARSHRNRAGRFARIGNRAAPSGVAGRAVGGVERRRLRAGRDRLAHRLRRIGQRHFGRARTVGRTASAATLRLERPARRGFSFLVGRARSGAARAGVGRGLFGIGDATADGRARVCALAGHRR